MHRASITKSSSRRSSKSKNCSFNWISRTHFGLSEPNLKLLEAILTSSLKSKSAVQIYVFGSRASGTQKKYSDIDLWIDSASPISTAEITTIRELIENSDLPIKVDLVSNET
jgi:predicted nucleotidyltransferase